MTDRHELHAYDYVNHPYAAVRDALLARPPGLFSTDLRATAGPIELRTEIEIDVGAIDREASVHGRPATTLAIEWRAARRPGWFPTMKATLAIYALSPTETQLELAGVYDPPLGVVGDALDAVALHRIAEQSVAGLVRDTAVWLRASLSSRSA